MSPSRIHPNLPNQCPYELRPTHENGLVLVQLGVGQNKRYKKGTVHLREWPV